MRINQVLNSNGNKIEVFLTTDGCVSPENVKFSISLNSPYEVLPVELKKEDLKELLLTLISYTHIGE